MGFQIKSVQHDYGRNSNHANVNVNLMAESVTQIKSGIVVNVDVNVKNIIYEIKIIFEILLHAIAKIVNIKKKLWMIQ